MNNHVESKWGWIARLCMERGYDEAERLAYKIDTALILLYGPLNTKHWAIREEDYRTESEGNGKGVTDMEIYDVANSPQYCIACQIQGASDGCRGCEFGKTHGRCNEANSVFDRFLDTFENCMDIAEEEEE